MKKFLSTKRANSHQTFKRTALFAVVAVVCVGLFWLLPAVGSFLGGLIVAPIDAATTWVRDSDHSLAIYLRHRGELDAEIATLTQSVAVLKNSSSTIATLQHENELLREQLGAPSSPRITAAVLARPPELPYDLLQINRGSRDGIVVGAPVFVGGEQLVGMVAHTAPSYAFVELATSPGFETTVFIYGPNIFTTAEGYGGGVLRVNVPQGVALNKDNVVIIPAADAGLFGSVSHVQTSPTQPQQYGYVVPPIPLQSIHTVAVGRKALPPTDYETARELVLDQEFGRIDINVPTDVLVVPATSTTATSSTTTSTSAE